MLSFKRLWLALAALVPLSLALPAGPVRAADGDEKEEADAPGTYTLRIRTAVPRKSPWGELLTNVATRIKNDSKGADGKERINIKIYWQVKSEAAAVRACTDGKAGGIAVSLGALASSVPEMEATEIPYLFDNYAQADKAMKAAEPLIAEILKSKGFIFAVRGENGFRQWASKTSFLTTPAAFKGRAMRSQPANVHKEMYRLLGATPNPLQISDVPTSLTNNVVDGYDNTLLFARLANWADAVTYVTLSNHIYQGAVIAWCKPWFDTLPPDLQAAITKRDAQTATLEKTGLDLVRVFNDKLMPEQYKKSGKQFKELTPAERAAFKTALAGVETSFRKSASPKGVELLDLLKRSR